MDAVILGNPGSLYSYLLVIPMLIVASIIIYIIQLKNEIKEKEKAFIEIGKFVVERGLWGEYLTTLPDDEVQILYKKAEELF